MVLEDWRLQERIADRYKAPEQRATVVCGLVYGHPAFAEGTRIRTAAVIELDYKLRLCITRDGIFFLGTPHPDYAALYPEALDAFSREDAPRKNPLHQTETVTKKGQREPKPVAFPKKCNTAENHTMTLDNYITYRFINGEKTVDYAHPKDFQVAIGEMVMQNSRTTFTSTELDKDTLVVECL